MAAEYDRTIQDHISREFGRQRGQLWRADRDWYWGGGPNVKQDMKDTLRSAKITREAQYDKGWSRERNLKLMGVVDFDVMMSNPALFFDDNETRRFFKENKKLSMDPQ